MLKKLAMACAALAMLGTTVVLNAQPAQAATGFYVSNGRLFDANNSEFVMRGVNHPYAWYKNRNSSFADIKRLGSNTVRVVLDLNVTTTEVTTVINLCKTNRLICMLEIHSTTGYGDNGAGTATLAQAASDWTNATIGAIRTIRNSGLTHTLVVDGPNWGQDWSNTMRNNASSVFNSDAQRNTVFSVHMYGVYGQASTINNYLNAFINARLPIIVGEFGNNHSDGDVDENTIFNTTQQQRIGYLGWSWSGNGSPVQYLDMTNGFNANSLTSWGNRIINGTNGIRATSRQATVY